MMNKLSNDDLTANADLVSQSTDGNKINKTNGETYVVFVFRNSKKNWNWIDIYNFVL